MASTAGWAQDTGVELRPVTVQSTREDLQGIAASASEGIVTSRQLATRPVLRAGDLMEAVPGMVATQHAGEGKANQYFLRGFNLDHGTDFATYVDGVPVNFPTHGHGQGYTDLYFVIPELVDSIAYRKGPYYAQEGDFSAAGSARLRLVRKLAQPFALVEAGSFGFRRALAAGSVPAAGGHLLLAAERSTDNGPWDVPQDLGKTNLLARYSRGTAANGWSLGLSHYQAGWTSTDQVPLRAVEQGLIGRYGTLDPTSGGRTRRSSAQFSAARGDGEGQASFTAYAIRYGFDLFSDFTYFTRGCDAAPLPAACNGTVPLDQFEQTDRRKAYGLSTSQARNLRLAETEATLSWGLDLRNDRIAEVALYETAQRLRIATVRADRARLTAAGLWTQAELQSGPQWRTTAGLRWDRHSATVTDLAGGPAVSASASLASPKLGAVYSASPSADWYANWGRGFHSNDARGGTPLVRAAGYELGTRQKIGDGLVLTGALWALQLDSELLFAGDAGTTEPSRPSRRRGLEFSANWRPAPGWEIDADLAWTRARFTDIDPAGMLIPGAMERVATVGATWQRGPWTLGARLRHFGSRPLIEDNSLRAPADTLMNLKAAWKATPTAELWLEVFNLFDRRSSDIEYAYASRLPGEAPFVDGVTPATLHFHPGQPRTFRAGLRLSF